MRGARPPGCLSFSRRGDDRALGGGCNRQGAQGAQVHANTGMKAKCIRAAGVAVRAQCAKTRGWRETARRGRAPHAAPTNCLPAATFLVSRSRIFSRPSCTNAGDGGAELLHHAGSAPTHGTRAPQRAHLLKRRQLAQGQKLFHAIGAEAHAAARAPRGDERAGVVVEQRACHPRQSIVPQPNQLRPTPPPTWKRTQSRGRRCSPRTCTRSRLAHLPAPAARSPPCGPQRRPWTAWRCLRPPWPPPPRCPRSAQAGTRVGSVAYRAVECSTQNTERACCAATHLDPHGHGLELLGREGHLGGGLQWGRGCGKSVGCAPPL